MSFSSFKTKIGRLPYLITVLAFLWTALAHAAGMESQTRKTGSFNKIELKGAYTVFLSQGDSCTVRLEAEPKTLEKITTEVKKDKLTVDTKSSGWFGSGKHNRQDILLYVTVKDLKGINIEGSAEVNGKGKFICDTMELSIAGSGDIVMELEVKLLETGISGSGDVKLSGKAQTLDASIAGSGDIRAFELKAEKCEVSIAGSGDCQVTASQELEITIAGSGDVSYKGDPAKIKNSIVGSGKIRKID